MNKKELEKEIGKAATVILNGLTVDVIIKEIKFSYGRKRYLISPIAGDGVAWMEDVKLSK